MAMRPYYGTGAGSGCAAVIFTSGAAISAKGRSAVLFRRLGASLFWHTRPQTEKAGSPQAAQGHWVSGLRKARLSDVESADATLRSAHFA